MKEFWLPIAGFEGFYAASDMGRVKSIARQVPRGDGFLTVKGRVLRPGIMTVGYPLVVLRRDGKAFPKTVHSLVLSAFVPKPSPRHEVDHINRVRDDNRLVNLRWATRSQNNGNSAGRPSRASSYRGVTPDGDRWVAQMGGRGGHLYLGAYDTEEEAAEAWDRAAKARFGEFAYQNFPEGVAP